VNEEIIAIHTGGGKENEQFNVGRLVTADMICNLNKWCKELNAVPFTQVPNQVCSRSKDNDLRAVIAQQKEELEHLTKCLQEERLKVKELTEQLAKQHMPNKILI
jgi:hypothetical protein